MRNASWLMLLGTGALLAGSVADAPAVRAAAALTSYADPEAGYRISVPAAWKRSMDEAGDWTFRRGGMAFTLAFEHPDDSDTPTVKAARQQLNLRRDLLLKYGKGKALTVEPLRVGSAVVPTVATELSEPEDGKKKLRHVMAMLPRPSGYVTVDMETTPAAYATHLGMLRSALGSVELVTPVAPRAGDVELVSTEVMKSGVSLPLPKEWKASVDEGALVRSSRHGALSVTVVAGTPSVPSDAYLIAHMAVTSAAEAPKVESEQAVEIHGWPGYLVRFRDPSAENGGHMEILAVLREQQVIYLAAAVSERSVGYMRELSERIRSEWRFTSAGPGKEGPGGAPDYQRRVLSDQQLELELPSDWKREADAGPLVHFGGGLAKLLVFSYRPGAGSPAQTPDLVLQEFLKGMEASSGGMAKIVHRETRQAKHLSAGTLAVFTLKLGPGETAKGWLFFAPAGKGYVITALLTAEDFYSALRPLMNRVLDTLKSTRPDEGGTRDS